MGEVAKMNESEVVKMKKCVSLVNVIYGNRNTLFIRYYYSLVALTFIHPHYSTFSPLQPVPVCDLRYSRTLQVTL